MEDGTLDSEKTNTELTKEEEYQRFLGELQEKLDKILNPGEKRTIGFGLFLFDNTGESDMGSMMTNTNQGKLFPVVSKYVTNMKNILRNKNK